MEEKGGGSKPDVKEAGFGVELGHVWVELPLVDVECAIVERGAMTMARVTVTPDGER